MAAGPAMAAASPAPQPLNGDDATDFGDSAIDSDQETDVECETEPWGKYFLEDTPNVYYPICLGEVLNKRYLVEHKIGFGSFSTVWMAHDLQDNKDVALKVICLGEAGEHEKRIHDEIIQNVQDTSHLVTYLATFTLPGVNGHHRVLVLPLMGGPLCISTMTKKPMKSRMSAAKQLLVALGNLHEAGIVHRDLSEINCMWGMAPLHHLSRSEKYKLLGRPLKMPIPEYGDALVNVWKQGELVRNCTVPSELNLDKIYLGDFGLTTKLGSPVFLPEGRPPSPYCSPDRLHGKGLTTACDMWSYMVLFLDLYLNVPPFYCTAVMVRSLGPLPKEWEGLYEHAPSDGSWYDQDQTPDPAVLDSRLSKTRSAICPTERQHVMSLIAKMFTYYPEKRLSARELLQDPDFKAIMDIYGC